MNIQNHCRSCRFWSKGVTIEGKRQYQADKDAGECRILPPKTLVTADRRGYDHRFPVTLADEWCGQHQPSASAR